jgi:multisubunit Na+/H+ antiporter MnhB subunit
MTVLSFSTYLPLDDLSKILVVALTVAVIAPSAVSMAIVGLDRRESQPGGAGTAMVVGGVAVLAALVALGLYALTQK